LDLPFSSPKLPSPGAPQSPTSPTPDESPLKSTDAPAAEATLLSQKPPLITNASEASKDDEKIVEHAGSSAPREIPSSPHLAEWNIECDRGESPHFVTPKKKFVWIFILPEILAHTNFHIETPKGEFSPLGISDHAFVFTNSIKKFQGTHGGKDKCNVTPVINGTRFP
jgi:hypothetical protein